MSENKSRMTLREAFWARQLAAAWAAPARAVDSSSAASRGHASPPPPPPATAFTSRAVKKLMLARALYKNGPIVVLDEPTAALDPIAESQLYQKYHELTQNSTSVYISHRLASTRFCDRVLLGEGGGIAEEGTHARPRPPRSPAGR